MEYSEKRLPDWAYARRAFIKRNVVIVILAFLLFAGLNFSYLKKQLDTPSFIVVKNGNN